MNKAELIEEVQNKINEASSTPDCSKAHAERAVNALLAAIKAGLQKDKEVQIVGFGTFAVKNRAARMGRNPQTNEPMQIKASTTVGFRPGSTLKASV